MKLPLIAGLLLSVTSMVSLAQVGNGPGNNVSGLKPGVEYCLVKIESHDPEGNLGTIESRGWHDETACRSSFDSWVKQAQNHDFEEKIMNDIKSINMTFVNKEGKDLLIKHQEKEWLRSED